jgi:hypothetical protein
LYRLEIDAMTRDRDRYVVSLIVGYGEDDFEGQSRFKNTPEGALSAALDLTRDDGAPGTIWHVYDLRTGRLHKFEQGEADA